MSLRTLAWTSVALCAFAANSILCRLALRETAIDAASFTAVRLASGALALGLLVRLRNASPADRGAPARGGSWASAAALFAYAAAFSFAYRELSAGAGALLLFGAVQTTMILWGLRSGERLTWVQALGLLLALAGLVELVRPKLEAPPFLAAASMLAAGVAWGVYSLRGRGARDPLGDTAGNFLRSVPFAALACLALARELDFDSRGAAYAAVSGAITSGLGYAVWYTALRGLDATRAATVQLAVPPLTAAAGVLWLGERFSSQLALGSIAILGGILLVIAFRKRRA